MCLIHSLISSLFLLPLEGEAGRSFREADVLQPGEQRVSVKGHFRHAHNTGV